MQSVQNKKKKSPDTEMIMPKKKILKMLNEMWLNSNYLKLK